MSDAQNTAQGGTENGTQQPIVSPQPDSIEGLAMRFATENAATETQDPANSESTTLDNSQPPNPDPKGGDAAPATPPKDIDDAALVAALSKRFGGEFKSLDELRAHFEAESAKTRPELVRRFEDYFTLKGGDVNVDEFVDAVKIGSLDLAKLEDTDALKTAFSLKEGLRGADLDERFGSYVRTSFGREVDVKGAEKAVESAKSALKAAQDSGDDLQEHEAALSKAQGALQLAKEDAADRGYKIAEASKAARKQIEEAQQKLAIPSKDKIVAQQKETQERVAAWITAEIARSAEEAKSKGIVLGKLHKDDPEPFTYKLGGEFEKANQTAQQMVDSLLRSPLSMFVDEQGNFSPSKAHSFFLKAALMEQNIAPSIAARYRDAGVLAHVNNASNPSVTATPAVTSTTAPETNPQEALFHSALGRMFPQ